MTRFSLNSSYSDSSAGGGVRVSGVTETSISIDLLSSNDCSVQGSSTVSQLTHSSDKKKNFLSYRLPWIKSKGAVLVLVWNLLVFIAISGAYSALIKRLFQLLPIPVSYAWTLTVTEMVRRICQIIPFPIAGWLADTYFGRYKTIRCSLWIIWLVSLPLVVCSTVEYQFWNEGQDDNKNLKIVIDYIVYPVAFVMMTIGLAGFHTNVFPFGTDQMLGASAQELTVFIHWYYWTEYIGFGIVYTFGLGCELASHGETSWLVQSLIQASCMTIAICLDYIFQNWLLIEPGSGNPIKIASQIIKFARTHTFPQQRSALTYWEEEIPSGVDLAKRRYGGPFTTEQVEDAKSLGRILTVFGSFVIPWVVFSGLNGTTAQITDHLRSGTDALNSTGYLCYETTVVDNLAIIVVILAVPIYHFIILPIFYNCIPGILKRISIGMFLLVLVALCNLVIDIKGHLTTCTVNSTVPCFLVGGASATGLDIDYRWLAIPNILTGLMIMIGGTAIYEFICAQVPYRMKGCVTGVNYSLFGFANAIGFSILLGFHYSYSSHPRDSGFAGCGFWYYLLNLMLALIGFALVCIAAKRYKPRQRNDLSFEPARIEEHYDRRQKPLT